MTNFTQLDRACANAIRILTLDAVQNSKSGHPGMPLGMADVAWVLFSRHVRYNPRDVKWFNRDRFVVSAGHGSMLPYSILYLTGNPDMTLDELKRFRQLHSHTPGHPENHLTPGIEVTTGPLGSGTANSVGMAIAERWLAAKYNRDGFDVVDHRTYAIVSDGDLMEGISHEAASLAGHLGLGKLLWFYDDNSVTIDGHDMGAVEAAIQAAHAVADRPSIICCKTVIGLGMPNRQGTRLAHSDEPGEAEVRAAKMSYGEDPDAHFSVRAEPLAAWRDVGARGAQAQEGWTTLWYRYAAAHVETAAELRAATLGQLPAGWDAALPSFNTGDKPMATRAASGATLNALVKTLPTLLGGSADLTPSNNTLPKDPATGKDFASLTRDDFSGRYIRFGIREHAMGGILNGLALHGGVIPYGGTFFTFSDFLRPTLRLAAISRAHSIFVFTHDSIGVGEDGPTHEPVEQLVSLRAIPHLLTLRPADANETVSAWKVAVAWAHGPVALLLTRQALPILPQRAGFERGAYVFQDADDPRVILVASGSEVSLALDAAKALAEKGVAARVVSMPSWELFDAQSDDYKAEVLPFEIPKVVIEAGVSMGWHKYTGPLVRFVTVETFGASAPVKDVMRAYGFTVENVLKEVELLLG